MSHQDDYRTGGLWPLQDHDPDSAIPGRSFMAGFRVERHSDSLGEPFTVPEPNSLGDVLGGLLVREIDGRREYLHSWWLTGCPVISEAPGSELSEAGGGAGGPWRVQRYPGVADDRLAGLDPPSHILTSQLWPGGWTGLVSAGSEETQQAEILHPDFLGLVAPHHGGREGHGTPVFDVDAEGSLDLRRFGRLQEHLRVALLPPRSGCMPGAGGREIGLLPWQLGVAKSGIDTGGLVADEPLQWSARTKPRQETGLPPEVYDKGDGTLVGPGPVPGTYVPYDADGNPLGGVTFFGPPETAGGTNGSVTRLRTVEREPTEGTQADDLGQGFHTVVDDAGLQWLAMTSVRHAGPFDVGGPGCIHTQGQSLDGERVGPTHLATQSIFRGPGGWDCGLEFQIPLYEQHQAGQMWLQTVLRQDPASIHETQCGPFAVLGRWETKSPVARIPPSGPPPPVTPPPPPPTEPPPLTPFDDPLPDPVFPPFDPEFPDPITPEPLPGPDDGLPGPVTGPTDDFLDPSAGGFRFPGGVNVIGSPQFNPPTPYVRDKGTGDKQALTASLSPMALPSVVYQPQNNVLGSFDYSAAAEITPEQFYEQATRVPVVGQGLAFGKTSGPDQFEYGAAPCTNQWHGGDADGGVMFAPPDVQITSPGASSSRNTFNVNHPDVIGGFGYFDPDAANASATTAYIVGGWQDYIDANGRRMTPVDSTGATESKQLTLDAFLDLRDTNGNTTISLYDHTNGGAIFMRDIDDANVPTPAAGHYYMFFDESNSGHLSRKDSTGTVTDVESGGGGSFDIDGLTAATPVSTDPIAFADLDDSGAERKVTFADMLAALGATIAGEVAEAETDPESAIPNISQSTFIAFQGYGFEDGTLAARYFSAGPQNVPDFAFPHSSPFTQATLATAGDLVGFAYFGTNAGQQIEILDDGSVIATVTLVPSTGAARYNITTPVAIAADSVVQVRLKSGEGGTVSGAIMLQIRHADASAGCAFMFASPSGTGLYNEVPFGVLPARVSLQNYAWNNDSADTSSRVSVWVGLPSNIVTSLPIGATSGSGTINPPLVLPAGSRWGLIQPFGTTTTAPGRGTVTLSGVTS